MRCPPMSTLRVQCANPSCQKVLSIRLAQAGKRIRCPICRVALIAPRIDPFSEAALHGEEAEEDAAAESTRPLWMTLLFVLGLGAGLFLTAALAVAFEVWLYQDQAAVVSGPTAALLTGGPWKVHVPKGKQAVKVEGLPAYFGRGMQWTFAKNGRVETGRLMDNRNRYDRLPAHDFRTWQWTTDGDQLKLTCQTQGKEEKAEFKVVQTAEDRLTLVGTTDEGEPQTVVFERAEPAETFPDWRIVFYAGVLVPMVVTLFLSWLISREVFHMGCLRFALAWPMTVLLGLALGAGAGFLMDMLDDHSHPVLPYWMLLSFAQGSVGLVMGLWLAVMSCLRPG